MGPRGGVCQCHQCLISLSHQVNHLLQCQILIICIFSFQNKFVRQKRSGKPCRTFHFTLLLFTSTFHIHLFYILLFQNQFWTRITFQNFSVFIFHFHISLFHISIIPKQICSTEKERRWTRKTMQNFSLFILHFYFSLSLFSLAFLSFQNKIVRQKRSGGGLVKPCRTFHFTLLIFSFTFFSRIYIILKLICSTEKERRWTRKTLQNFSLSWVSR